MSSTVFTIANLGIFCGYLFIAVAIVPHFAVTRWYTKVGGGLFFLTCGTTHLELALHSVLTGGFDRDDLLAWHMLGVHTVQVVAVWMFITGLYVEFVRPQLGKGGRVPSPAMAREEEL